MIGSEKKIPYFSHQNQIPMRMSRDILCSILIKFGCKDAETKDASAKPQPRRSSLGFVIDSRVIRSDPQIGGPSHHGVPDVRPMGLIQQRKSIIADTTLRPMPRCTNVISRRHSSTQHRRRFYAETGMDRCVVHGDGVCRNRFCG